MEAKCLNCGGTTIHLIDCVDGFDLQNYRDLLKRAVKENERQLARSMGKSLYPFLDFHEIRMQKFIEHSKIELKFLNQII